MFESLDRLLLGLFTGFLFGVLLQKGGVAKYRVIVGQFRLQDWTVVKVMSTAVVVGAIGVFALHAAGLAAFHIKPLVLGGVLVGGALFGIGMGLLGYCPGTCVAACGEGRRDAIVGLLGQFAGAAIFVMAYPWLETVIQWGALGKRTFPDVTHTSAWLWIAGIAIVALLSWYKLGRFTQSVPSLDEPAS